MKKILLIIAAFGVFSIQAADMKWGIGYTSISDDDVKDGYEETINDFKSLENYIIMCKNNLEEAIKITPLNTDPNPFEWDYNIKQEAKKIWQKVRK